MSAKTLNIVRLTRFPQAAQGDELLFKKGVNLLVGDKDSGKTGWLRMFDYVLGDSGDPVQLFGEDMASRYDTIEAEIQIDQVKTVLRRSWSPSAPRTKTLVDGEPHSGSELSDWLLEKLEIPRLHFPKGNPYAERAWPALSFRTLFRHVFRQEGYWTDIADKQPEADQHACIALFLGVAETLFPEKFGELVEKQKLLYRVQAQREVHQQLLDELSRDLVPQKEMTVTVTDSSIDEAERRLREEIGTIENQRDTLLTKVRDQADGELNGQMRHAKEQLATIHSAMQHVEGERALLTRKLSELRPYSEMLQAELDRFARAQSSSDLIANIKVTHCPVCDQETHLVANDHTCYLCRRPYLGEDHGASTKRVDFERAQLHEEKIELDELIISLGAQLSALDNKKEQLKEQEARLETDLRPAQKFALSFLPPDLAILDQNRGRLNEQLESLQRVRKSLQLQKTLTAQIDKLLGQEASIKAELSAGRAELDLTQLSELFEERLNDYFNRINEGHPTRWKHGRVTFTFKEKSFTLKANEKLGATSQALLLFAYHYALLSLVADKKFYYPGLTIIDFPLKLSDGASILDSENYLVEPFIELCTKPGMEAAQFIAAGHAFDNLQGAHFIQIMRPTPLPQ